MATGTVAAGCCVALHLRDLRGRKPKVFVLKNYESQRHHQQAQRGKHLPSLLLFGGDRNRGERSSHAQGAILLVLVQRHKTQP